MYVHVYLVLLSLKPILTFMANYLLQGKTKMVRGITPDRGIRAL